MSLKTVTLGVHRQKDPFLLSVGRGFVLLDNELTYRCVVLLTDPERAMHRLVHEDVVLAQGADPRELVTLARHLALQRLAHAMLRHGR